MGTSLACKEWVTQVQEEFQSTDGYGGSGRIHKEGLGLSGQTLSSCLILSKFTCCVNYLMGPPAMPTI